MVFAFSGTFWHKLHLQEMPPHVFIITLKTKRFSAFLTHLLLMHPCSTSSKYQKTVKLILHEKRIWKATIVDKIYETKWRNQVKFDKSRKFWYVPPLHNFWPLSPSFISGRAIGTRLYLYQFLRFFKCFLIF